MVAQAVFTGTLDKCTACDKTVYCVDFMSADGAIYHKSCFKCSYCKGTLVMSNYSSMGGVMYCKPHFEQLFKEAGNFTKNFPNSKPEWDNSNSPPTTPSKVSALFSGTQDRCTACDKIVYPLDKVTMEDQTFHRSCFRCSLNGCLLTHSSSASLDNVLYCKHHFQRLFLEKGNFQHVLQVAADKKAELTPRKGRTEEEEEEDKESEATPRKDDEEEEEDKEEHKEAEATPRKHEEDEEEDHQTSEEEAADEA